MAGLLFATGVAVPAVAFAQTGHWVVNANERSVVHVDGGTAQGCAHRAAGRRW